MLNKAMQKILLCKCIDGNLPRECRLLCLSILKEGWILIFILFLKFVYFRIQQRFQFSLQDFRCCAVLGRGHFGKVPVRAKIAILCICHTYFCICIAMLEAHLILVCLENLCVKLCPFQNDYKSK